MCGIVGYTGNRQAAEILLDGLSKLEYRGYDSAGLAVRDGEKLAVVVKAKGRLSNLSEKVDGGKALKGSCGIGHTRWATHGEPSEKNAHPHVAGNCTGSGAGEVESDVVGVHNGIIENYAELKDKLSRHGYRFYSDTDTEVAIKLVDYYYKKYKMGPVDAIAKAMVRIRGSYALELMFKDYPEQIWVARKDSPMIIGVKDDESFIASDVPAILKYTRNVYYIGNLEFACVKKGSVDFYDLNGDIVKKDTTEIHNLRVENQRLQKYIDEYGPQSDGYSVEDISPIMQLSLETGTGEIRAYGISESRNEMFAYNKAVTHATANLRKKMELYIRYGIDMYNDELETDDGSSISNKTREQVVNACKGIVEGINIIKCQKYYNRYKHMYRYEVCVKYDKENIISNIKSQDRQLLKKEKEFERDMMDAWDELDKYQSDKNKSENAGISLEPNQDE